MAGKGDWGTIHVTVLPPEGRAPSVPEDTKKVPLELFVKGHLQADAEIGDAVTVKTRTERLETGVLVEQNPCYTHSYGKYVPEIEKAGDDIVSALFGRES